MSDALRVIEARLTKEAYALVVKSGGKILMYRGGEGVSEITTPQENVASLEVCLKGDKFPEKELRLLRLMGPVVSLTLYQVPVTDRGLAHLQELSGLRDLS